MTLVNIDEIVIMNGKHLWEPVTVYFPPRWKQTHNYRGAREPAHKYSQAAPGSCCQISAVREYIKNQARAAPLQRKARDREVVTRYQRRCEMRRMERV